MGKLEKKDDTRGSRVEAARRLTKLAGIVAEGRADILGQEVILGHEVESRWGVTVRDGFIQYDLSLKIPVSETGRTERNGHETYGSKEGFYKGTSTGRGRYNAKKHKKTTGALWKIVKKAVQEGIPVSDADATAMIENLSGYDEFVEPEWSDRWERCTHAVVRCIQASRAGDVKAAQALMKEVNALTRACHKRYK